MVSGTEINAEMREQAQSAVQRASSAYRGAKDYAGEKVQEAARGVGAGMHREGTVTKAIEHFTSQVPSGTYLTLALGAMAGSALLALANRREDANFVGQWVPTILIMGLYNKLVKLEGSD